MGNTLPDTGWTMKCADAPVRWLVCARAAGAHGSAIHLQGARAPEASGAAAGESPGAVDPAPPVRAAAGAGAGAPACRAQPRVRNQHRAERGASQSADARGR